jgi:hypothetical protein
MISMGCSASPQNKRRRWLLPKPEIYIDAKPAGHDFAGTQKTKTKAEVTAGFAAFVEGTKP